MPSHLVLQPNGKYAIWSTVVDDFWFFDGDAKEVGDAVIEFQWQRGKADADVLQSRIDNQIKNIEKSGTAWDWAKDWNRGVRWLEETTNSKSLARIDELGLPRRMKRKVSSLKHARYWLDYWRGRAERADMELSYLKASMRVEA